MTDVVDPVVVGSWTKDEPRDEELSPEQEVEKLRAEKIALQRRVVGVNELARLLQERTTELEIMGQKNQRLEVALVRMENRCSNYEKKMKAQSGALPKSGQMPVIPGPSRQILDSLMLENRELKKVINKQASKGPTSYLEAVKTYQLEEMVEQQRQDIEFYKSQLMSLGLADAEDEKALSMPADGEPPGINNTRALKLKVAKLQQTMRVKDKFCSLLAERVTLLEKQLHDQMSSHSLSPDLSQQPQSLPAASPKDVTTPHAEVETQTDTGDTEPSPQELRKLEAEKSALEGELIKKENELSEKEKEIKRLSQMNEDLTLYNKTLVDEKKTASLNGGRAPTDHDLEKLQSELRDLHVRLEESQKKTQKLEQEKHSLEDQVEHLQVERAISESKLSDHERETKQKIQELSDQVENLSEDLSVAKSKFVEARTQRELAETEIKKLKAARTVTAPQYYNRIMASGGHLQPAFATDVPFDPVAVKDYGQRCQTSGVDSVVRPPTVMARSVPDETVEPEPTHQPRPQTIQTLRSVNPSMSLGTYPSPHQSLPTHPQMYRLPTVAYTPGSYVSPNSSPITGYHPLPPTARVPQDPNVRAMRGHTMPLSNIPPPQLHPSRSHPASSLHPAFQQIYSNQFDHSANQSPHNSIGSNNSSGYFGSGLLSSENTPPGLGGLGGNSGSSGSQQQPGGSYHGHTGSPQ